MDLLSFALSLALPFGPEGFSGDYSLDFSPTFGIEAPTANWGASATSIPGAVLYDPRFKGTSHDIHTNPELMRHELGHQEQQRALGGAFFPAYALTGGRGFEPYDPMARFVPGTELRPSNDMGRTWMPNEDEQDKFPFFRISSKEGRTSAELLPGYPRFIDLKLR